MINKKENCQYCGQKMESATARKRFCSDKCRVYFGREIKMAGNQLDRIILKLDKTVQSSPNLKVSSKLEPIPIENNKMPPEGLKGIELAIWKAENQE